MDTKAKALYNYTWTKKTGHWTWGGVNKDFGLNMTKGEIVTVLRQMPGDIHAEGHLMRIKNSEGKVGNVLSSYLQIIDNSKQLHEKEMAELKIKQQEEATKNKERLMREQARLEKERKAEEVRQQAQLERMRAEQRRQDEESRARIESQRRANEQARERLKQQAAKDEAERQMRLKKFDAEQKKKEAERKAEEEQRQRAHEKAVKDFQLKQQGDKTASLQKQIEDHDAAIETATAQMEKEDEIIGQSDESLKSLDLKVQNYNEYRARELNKTAIKVDLKTKKDKFHANDDEIKAAINKTGQTESNVGKFLELTHGLLGATMKTAMDTNKMGSQISTFNELIQRECADTLTIKQLALRYEHLKRFVPLFAAKGTRNVRSLECHSEKAFEGIVSMLKEATARKREEDAAKKREEEASAMLEKIRREWTMGSECEVFPKSQGQWLGGQIMSVDKREDGEWLEVQYDGGKMEIQRESEWIRPCAAAKGDENQLEAAEEADAETKEEAQEVSAEALLAKWKLSKFWEKMEEDGWDEPQDWPEMTKEDLAEIGIKGGNLKKWQRGIKSLGGGAEEEDGDDLLSEQEMNMLRRICFKPETWQKFEDAQEMAARSGLKSTSPLLSEFFERIYGGIKRSDKFLELAKAMNSEQSKAIEMANKQPPPKALTLGDPLVEEPDDDEDDAKTQPDAAVGGDDEVKDDPADLEPVVEEPADDKAKVLEDKIRMEWMVGSQCEVFSESQQNWCGAKIVAVRMDEGDEWMMVEYDGGKKEIQRGSNWLRPSVDAQDENNKLVLHSQALKEAALAEMDITEKMMTKFTESAQTKRALTVALGVEDCCKQVIMSQSTIRQSVLLSMAILDLKPSNMTKEAQALWDAVDTGVTRLMRSAITMAKASCDFFGYFLRFKSSFQYYESNIDAPLLVSLQFLHKDVNEFSSFQAKFMEQVNSLNDEAMQCINNCVKQQGGAAAFEAARKARERNQNEYLMAKAVYDGKEVELDMEFDKLQAERVGVCAEKARAQSKRNTLNDSIEQHTEFVKELQAAKVALEKTIIK